MSARREILMRQEALRRTIERKLRGRMAAELRFTAKAAANAYPNWERAIAPHELRVGTILEQFYALTLRRSAQEIEGAVEKAGIELSLKAKRRVSDNLGGSMRAWAWQHAAQKVVEIGHTTRERIRSAVDAALKDGGSDADVAKSIARRAGGAIASSRALTIARTESHAAAQAGGLMAAKELGVVQTKEWVAAEDERTRETHADADGQVVGIDEDFEVGDAKLHFPGDPSGPAEEVVNCRCVIAYGIKTYNIDESETLQENA